MKHAVATVEEIPPGRSKIVEVAGRSIGVFNVGGEFFALRNSCPHQGGPLCTGRVSGFVIAETPGEYQYSRQGEILRCPWHGWEFDIRTGQSWFDPAKVRVRRYDVTVAPGSAATDEPPPAPGLAPGPYVAETYDVSVEQQLILVDVPGSGGSNPRPLPARKGSEPSGDRGIIGNIRISGLSHFFLAGRGRGLGFTAIPSTAPGRHCRR